MNSAKAQRPVTWKWIGAAGGYLEVVAFNGSGQFQWVLEGRDGMADASNPVRDADGVDAAVATLQVVESEHGVSCAGDGGSVVVPLDRSCGSPAWSDLQRELAAIVDLVFHQGLDDGWG